MYIRYTAYRCPSCDKQLESRIVSSPRVGQEQKNCAMCGCTYQTPDREWRNMTKGQRLGYFLSEWTVGWIGISILAGIILSEDNRSLGAFYGLAVGMILCAPSWLIKLWRVRQSDARSTVRS